MNHKKLWLGNGIVRWGPAPAGSSQYNAFTLIELLVVVTIIGILAALTLPAFKGISQSNIMAAASRQLADDLSLARLKAINERTTVYVVFVPSNVADNVWLPTNGFTTKDAQQVLNLVGGQFTDYALYAPRSVGDQPAPEFWHGRYLTEWKSLPEGVFIAPQKFVSNYNNGSVNPPLIRHFESNNIPFPNSFSKTAPRLPYIAFNSQGQLISGADEVIPLARGSILYPKDATDNFVRQFADLVETPPGNHLDNYNHLRVNWLTGRTKVERPELK